METTPMRSKVIGPMMIKAQIGEKMVSWQVS